MEIVNLSKLSMLFNTSTLVDLKPLPASIHSAGGNCNYRQIEALEIASLISLRTIDIYASITYGSAKNPYDSNKKIYLHCNTSCSDNIWKEAWKDLYSFDLCKMASRERFFYNEADFFVPSVRAMYNFYGFRIDHSDPDSILTRNMNETDIETINKIIEYYNTPAGPPNYHANYKKGAIELYHLLSDKDRESIKLAFPDSYLELKPKTSNTNKNTITTYFYVFIILSLIFYNLHLLCRCLSFISSFLLLSEEPL